MSLPKLSNVTARDNQYPTRFISGSYLSEVNADTSATYTLEVGETIIDCDPPDYDCLFFLASGCHITSVDTCYIGNDISQVPTVKTDVKFTGKVSYQVNPGKVKRSSMIGYIYDIQETGVDTYPVSRTNLAFYQGD